VSGKGFVRRSALAATRTKAFGSFVGALERLLPERPGRLGILTYHHVADPARSPLLYPGLFTDPLEFAAQMDFLVSRHRPVSLNELLGARRGDHALPLRSVLVTFDDGYRDFADHAWPILRRLGIPATLFIPTAYPGNPGQVFWWDRLYSALSSTDAEVIETPDGDLRLASSAERLDAYRTVRERVKSLPHEEGMALVDEVCETLGAPQARSDVLGWPDLRRLAAEGVDLAPHSRTHPLLDKVPIEAARAEILGSLEDLEREVGRGSRVFAYPGGGESPEVVRVLEDEGFELAFSTRRGTNDIRTADWLRLRRINVGHASAVPLLHAQLLSGWPRPTTDKGGSRRPRTVRRAHSASNS
jgi:peptidoglycan/xylan/chitin deacetylase (PgdA/CDA1 family)